MAILPILLGENHPMLRKKALPVKRVTKETLKLIKDMEQTTVQTRGAGLAAPQIGRSERIVLCMIGKKLTPLINPVILKKSKEAAIAEEGCLSLPDVWVNVSRSTEIVVSFTDHKNKKVELALQNFDARVVQHEVDHLDGVLIVDYR